MMRLNCRAVCLFCGLSLAPGLVARAEDLGGSYDPGNLGLTVLFGDTHEDYVRLAWSARKWPENLVGFQIGRRPKGVTGGDWKMLTSKAIQPSISEKPDLADLEPDAAKREEATAKFGKFLSSQQTLTPMSAEQFREKAQDKDAAFRSSVGNEWRGIFEYTLAMRLGYVDRHGNRAELYDYGLFPEYKEGLAKEPSSVYESVVFSKDDPRLTPKLVAQISSSRLFLEITIKDSIASRYGVHLFRLYRRAAGTSEFQERASVTKFTGNPMAREMTWGIGDRIPTRDTRKFEYEVGIVNVFGTELARMSVPGTVPP